MTCCATTVMSRSELYSGTMSESVAPLQMPVAPVTIKGFTCVGAWGPGCHLGSYGNPGTMLLLGPSPSEKPALLPRVMVTMGPQMLLMAMAELWSRCSWGLC